MNLILNNLSDPGNPLTHSDIYSRTGETFSSIMTQGKPLSICIIVKDHVVSASSGHQVSDGKARGKTKEYLNSRSQKIKAQIQDSKSASGVPQVMKHVNAYINGFMEGTTDIEMKRIISEAGGTISYAHPWVSYLSVTDTFCRMSQTANTTHIITSMKLSGSKTQKLLNKKQGSTVSVVKPSWVFDSIDAGKRQAERRYSILSSSNEATNNLANMFSAGGSKGKERDRLL